MKHKPKATKDFSTMTPYRRWVIENRVHLKFVFSLLPYEKQFAHEKTCEICTRGQELILEAFDPPKTKNEVILLAKSAKGGK